MKNTWYYIVMLTLLLSHQVLGQRKIVPQTALFTTEKQNMWGPGDAPGINQTIEIFPEYKTRLPFNTSDFTILKIEGLKFGAGIDGYFEFGIGPFQFVIEGFELGEIDVDYPTNLSIDLPDDNTFNPGETILINSSFSAAPGADLITRYPNGDTARVALEMGLLFDADLGFTACLGSCTPRFSLINPPSRPLLDQDFKFFEVRVDQITHICPDPLSLFQCTLSSGGPPWAFTDPQGIFTAEAELPNVSTVSQLLGGTDLQAIGEHQYVNNSLNVIKLMGLIPVVKPFANVIEGSEDLLTVKDFAGNDVTVTVSWALVRVTLNIPITQKQEFYFKPEVVTKLNFPDTVDYIVHSKTNGDIVGKGVDLEYVVGDEVSVDFPCEYDYMDVFATHRINNVFSNKTNDNIGLNLKIEALEFGLDIDPFIIIPEICIPIPFSSDLCVGPVGTSPISETFGPLWEPEPIVLLDQDFPPYIDKSWELEGFEDFSVTQPFRLLPRKAQIDFSTTDILCNGEQSGTITTTFANATEPVKYEWSFGSSQKNPVGVPAGTHQVKITDARGCVRFESVTINQPKQLEAQISASEIACNGQNQANIDLMVDGGVSNYSYLWSTGATTPTLENQPAGTYSVAVTDNNGCSTSRSITIKEPEPLVTGIFNPITPSCFGNDNGSLDLYVEGGTAPFTFLWSNGQIGQSIEEITAGNYSVIITDANGCTSNSSILLTQPAALTASMTKESDVSCFASSDGALSVSVQGGTPPYAYSWSNDLQTLGTKTSRANDLKSGNYAVEVIDDNGCRIVAEETIVQPDIPLQAQLEPSHLTCIDDSDGAIDLTVTGGTLPYQYQWTNGAQTEDISGITEGVYEVLITDANNCEVGTKTLIISPKPITLSVLVENISCADQSDGQAQINSISGGFEPYSVAWSDGSDGMMIENVTEGQYSVTVSDNAGCTLSKNFEIAKNEGTCLFIPNTFSPNGDGINDTWRIRNVRLYPNIQLRVFNKWGLDVFNNTGYNEPWNGTHNGNILEPGTYYYIIDLNDGSPVYQGALSILQ